MQQKPTVLIYQICTLSLFICSNQSVTPYYKGKIRIFHFFSEWPPKGIPYNRRVNANKVTKEKKKKLKIKSLKLCLHLENSSCEFFPSSNFFVVVVSFSSVIQCKPELLTCLFDNDMYSMERTFLYNKKKRKFSLCYTIYARKRWSLSKKKK